MRRANKQLIPFKAPLTKDIDQLDVESATFSKKILHGEKINKGSQHYVLVDMMQKLDEVVELEQILHDKPLKHLDKVYLQRAYNAVLDAAGPLGQQHKEISLMV